MEKVKLSNSRNKCIVGNLADVNSNSLAILAHGFTNDKSSNGRFDSLAEALNVIGFDTYSLDFTGSGESDDGALTVENQTDDLITAIDYFLEKPYKQIILIGNSFGTLSCLNSYRNEICTMILIGAVTDKMNYQWDEFFTSEQIDNLNSNGFIKLNDKREHLIIQQTLKDFEEVNQDDLIRKVKCPVLIIHGDNIEDIEELQLLSHSQRAIKKLPIGSKLEIIKDGKHGLHSHWDEVIKFTSQWLEQFQDCSKNDDSMLTELGFMFGN